MKKALLLISIITLPIFLQSCGEDEETTKRCQAITQDGDQCKRNAEEGSNYCWQHKK